MNRARLLCAVINLSIVVYKHGSKGEPIYCVVTPPWCR